MAKKIRLPLIMENGVEVRTIEELQEHFSLEKVVTYVNDGKMDLWLRERYLDDIAEQLNELNAEDGDYFSQICSIFQVQMCVASDQDELYDLLDEDESEIYLYGEKFSVPVNKKNVHYYGINNPVVSIFSNEVIDFAARGISFTNVRFDEKYQKVLDAAGAAPAESVKVAPAPAAPAKESASLSAAAKEEINGFKVSLKEHVKDFDDEVSDYLAAIDSVFSDFSASCEVDVESSDCGFDEYESKEEATAACLKELAEKYASAVKEWVESAKAAYENACKEIHSEIVINLKAFVDDFTWAYNDLLEDEVSAEAASYIKKAVGDVLGNEAALRKLFDETGVKNVCDQTMKKMLVLPSAQEFDMNQFLPDCEIDYDGDVYTADVDSALYELGDALVDRTSSILVDMESELSDVYLGALDKYCAKITEMLDAL